MTQRVLDLRNPSGNPRGKRKRLIIMSLAALIAVAVIGIAVMLAVRHFTQAPTGEAEGKAIQAKVARHYILPADEVPALATVTDKSKASALFLKDAKNGDKILLYPKSRLAIVYRPSADRLVAVGPIITNDSTQQ
jgi:hypothetical protein